jgi:hypothetical protein
MLPFLQVLPTVVQQPRHVAVPSNAANCTTIKIMMNTKIRSWWTVLIGRAAKCKKQQQ